VRALRRITDGNAARAQGHRVLLLIGGDRRNYGMKAKY